MPRRLLSVLLAACCALAAWAGTAAATPHRPALFRHGFVAAKKAPTRRPAAQLPPVVTRVTRRGSGLALDGKPWKFTGANAFGATTDWDVNWGCGSPVDDLDQLFSSLRPGSVVRTWAFQALAWNDKAATPHLDFTAIDRVVAAAQRNHQLLDLVLSDQAGTCDDGVWHDPAWYLGGYKDVRNDDGRGLGDLSYLDYVKTIVARYKDSPAIAFWEPVNEAEGSTCVGATGSACWDNSKRSCDDSVAGPALRSFFDAIGATIRSIDPHHLISSGLAGGLQCGVDGGWDSYISASPGIDVLSYHDYSAPNDVLTQWLGVRIGEAAVLGKPLVVGEAGANACDGDRAQVVNAKLQAAFAAGAVGYLPWWWSQSPGACGDDFGPGDPLLQVLADAPTR